MFRFLKNVVAGGSRKTTQPTRPSFRPTVESLEERWTPSTFTVVNKSTQVAYVQFVEHQPGTSGMLGDGTSWEAPEPGYWDYHGSGTVQPGTAQTFNTGDKYFDVRVSNGYRQTYYSMQGHGISFVGSRVADLSAAYDIRAIDGSNTVEGTAEGEDIGQWSYSAFNQAVRWNNGWDLPAGVQAIQGFYQWSAGNDVFTISGPLHVVGTKTISFADYTPSGSFNTDPSKFIYTTWTPSSLGLYGAHFTSYSTPQLSSSRGASIQFVLGQSGSSLQEIGNLSGSYYVSSPWDWGYSGGSYVGTIQVSYAY